VVFLLAIADLAIFFHARITVRHAVTEAARFAITGNALPDPESEEGDNLSRAESILDVIGRSAQSVRLDLDDVDINPPDGGGPEELVTITATYHYRSLFPALYRVVPDGLQFSVSTSVRNEPFIGE
jgi:hypothetical protein